MTNDDDRPAGQRRDATAAIVWAAIFSALSLWIAWTLSDGPFAQLTVAAFVPMVCAIMYAKKTFEAADAEQSFYRSQERRNRAVEHASNWFTGAIISMLSTGFFAFAELLVEASSSVADATVVEQLTA